MHEGIFIILAKAIESYLTTYAKKTMCNAQSILDQRHELTRLVKKQDSLIRNTKGSRIHSYCVGRWENRQVLSGIVVAPNVLLEDVSHISVNSSLSIDPIDY